MNEIQHFQLDYQSDPHQGSVDTDTAGFGHGRTLKSSESDRLNPWSDRQNLFPQVPLSIRVCTWSSLNLEGKV